MKFCVLGSGSKGNATYIEADGVHVLIDAGFSGKELTRRLQLIGVAVEDISAILVTHEHHDHIHGAGILSRKHGISVYINKPTARAGEKRLGKVERLHFFDTGQPFTIGAVRVHPFSISHDTADPVGFVLEASGRRLGYCTDTGMVSRLVQQRLAGCHGLILECNHDPQMLSDGPYPLHLQQRVRSREGHLANLDAAEFIGELLHRDLRHVVLAHLSETNNQPKLALDTVTGFLATEKTGCDFPEISLGWQDRPGNLVEL
jgi:phosphoribosyl 1,2-cyclic phosphodiesterase